MDQLGLIALVFLGGFVDSIAGGGGLITLPAYLAVGLPPHVALATNKFSSSLGTLVAVIRFALAKKVLWTLGLVAAGCSLVGSALGSELVLLVPERAVKPIVLLLILLVSVWYFLGDRWARLKKPTGRLGAKTKLRRSALLGGGIGTYDGFFGPGTGTFLAMGFQGWMGLDLVSASANARLTNLASNLGSVIVFLIGGWVLFPLALFAALAGILGNALGSSLALKGGARLIRPMMALVVLLLLVQILRSWGAAGWF